jgi:hypothetical protein
MKILHKNLLIITNLFLFMGAGCTTQTTTNSTVSGDLVTNTNTVSDDNTNIIVDSANTNETVEVDNTNVNTNTESDEAVDTSDWLTYTNEEYGFSFKYPAEWGNVDAQSGLPAGEASLLFSNRENATDQYSITPVIKVYPDVTKIDPEDNNGNLPSFDYQAIDFAKSDAELSEDLKRPGATSDMVTKTKIGNKNAVQINETKSDLTGEQLYTVFIIVPDFSGKNTHFRVVINGSLTDQLSTFINTITF